MTASTLTSPLTPERQAHATYEQLRRRRDAAGYVMTRVHLDTAVDAALRYSALAQATREALETWMQFKTREVC